MGVGRYDDGDPTGTMGPGTIGEKAASASLDVRWQFESGDISAEEYRSKMAEIDEARMEGDEGFFDDEGDDDGGEDPPEGDEGWDQWSGEEADRF